MWQYPYPFFASPPTAPSTMDEVKKYQEWIDGIKKQLEESSKKKDDKPKARTFSFLEVFILLCFSSIVIGPIASLTYLNYTINLLKSSGLLQLLK